MTKQPPQDKERLNAFDKAKKETKDLADKTAKVAKNAGKSITKTFKKAKINHFF